jgi:chromosome segregation ATPase
VRQCQEQIRKLEEQGSGSEAEHRRAIQLLETRLDDLHAENARVLEEKEQLETRMRESNDERHTQEASMITELREERDALAEEISLAENNLDLVIRSACSTSQDLRAVKQGSHEAHLDHALLQHEAQLMQQRMDHQASQIKKLKSQLRHSEQANMLSSYLVEQLDNDIKMLLSERAADRHLAANSAESDEPDFEQAVQDWEEERSGLLFTLDLTRKESEHSHLELSRITARMEDLQSRESAGEEMRVKQEEELNHLRTEVEEFRKEAASQQKELSVLRSERSKFGESFQQLKASTWEEKAHGQELREELQSVKHELEAARDFAKSLEVTLSQAQAMETYLQEQKQE